MKKSKICIILILSVLLFGCGSSKNKILGIIELNKTTSEELSDLNFEVEEIKVWNAAKGIFEYLYICHFAEYSINGVDGIIRIPFEEKVATFVNFSAEAQEDSMEKLLAYLVETYGKDYEKIEDYTTRWVSGELTIDYVLTDEDIIEVRWYISE